MSYVSLSEKIKLLPEECLDEAENYIEQLLKRIKGKRRLGIANGKFDIPEDIDSLNDEVADLFGVN